MHAPKPLYINRPIRERLGIYLENIPFSHLTIYHAVQTEKRSSSQDPPGMFLCRAMEAPVFTSQATTQAHIGSSQPWTQMEQFTFQVVEKHTLATEFWILIQATSPVLAMEKS